MRKIALLGVVYMATLGQLLAQKRTTVIMNSSLDSLCYKFDCNNLPNSLVVSEDDVKLNFGLAKNKLDAKQIQNLTICQKSNNSNIGTKRVDKNSSRLNIPLDLTSLKSTLELQAKFSSQNIENMLFFHSSNPQSKNYNIAKQPKLVIDYEINQEPYRSDWAQASANAQHTNASDWKAEVGTISSTNSRMKYAFAQSCLAIYKNQLVVLNKNNYTISLVKNSKSFETIWTSNAFPSTSLQPIIDAAGRMFYFTANAIVVLNLENGTIEKAVSLKEISIAKAKDNSFAINSIKDEVTMGYDGTFYMPISNSASRIGIVALSAYPSLKPRWFYETTNPVGQVSLSENEKMAFFIETNSTEKKSKLVVLDNTNGEVVATSKETLSAYTNDINSYIPPVVIQTIDKDNSTVFVLDGNETAKKMFVFKINDNAIFKNGLPIRDSILVIDPKDTIQSTNTSTNNIGISRAVVTKKGSVYFIKDQKLTKYNAPNNYTDIFSTKLFDNNSKIIANATDQLYVLAGSKIAFIDDTTPRASEISVSSEYNKKAIVAPNLNVFYSYENYIYSATNTIGEDKEITAINNKTLYNYTNISINKNVTVAKNTNAIIVGNTIKINKNFTVQKGAELTFQINNNK